MRRLVTFLERRYFLAMRQGQINIVEPIEQAVAVGRINVKVMVRAVRPG